ncbi:4Fe-4S binding protein [Eubacteriaceae bacterium ES2]|nr:4Fe-4S binding protein [Eubacteriaceae bacterium ES2]
MSMKTKEYLKILKEEIHSTVIATKDDRGFPVTRVIDIMLVDDVGLYFLTAKGKAFYEQLMTQNYVALTGMTSGTDSMKRKAISIRGRVKNIGDQKLTEIFEGDPYMATIYPSEVSRRALQVFCLYEGAGEYFDLSTKPIRRANFVIGKSVNESDLTSYGYTINNQCTGCGACLEACPQNCIITEKIPFTIEQSHCLHCGNCVEICTFGAVEYGKKE